MQEAKPEALEAMQASPYNYPDTRWVAYENHALDSGSCGELRFLAVGPHNTYQDAPDRYPDSHLGVGWRYVRIGWVDLKTGAIEANVKRSSSSPLAL